MRKSIVAGAVAIAAAAATLFASTPMQLASDHTPPPVPQYMVDGCIIRFVTATPEILDTGGHVCSPRVIGVSVSSNGDLWIHTSPVEGIVSAIIEEDETLTARNIQAGPSVGFDKTVVRFAQGGRVIRADSTEVRGAYSNIFVTWVTVPLPENP